MSHKLNIQLLLVDGEILEYLLLAPTSVENFDFQA